MNGTRKKKLRLESSFDEFISRMIFHSEPEKEKCINYLNLKGVSYHVILANYIGLNRKGEIEYKKVETLYKYDKRVRNILYSYLSAFEEGIRAFISNRFSTSPERIKKLSKKIHDAIQGGSSLAKELEALEFLKLLNMTKKLTIKEKSVLFGTDENLNTNLDAIRVLRNAVSHHRQLFLYDDLNECIVDGENCDSLIHNIKNMHNLLPDYYKEFFKEDINKSCVDEKEPNFKWLLPEKALLKL